MLIFIKKFYNFIISSFDSFSALFNHVEKVQVLSSFDLFFHIVWIVFVMLVVGFIIGILVKFKIVYYFFYFIGSVVYKVFSFLFKTKKLSEQEKYYRVLNEKRFASYYPQPVVSKKTSNGKLPYAQYKELEKYVLKKHGVNSFKRGNRK